MTIEPNIHNQDCNISPDELYCLVLVGVVPAVAELDQLLVRELIVPHDVAWTQFSVDQTTFTAVVRGFNVRSYSLCFMTHCTALAMTLQFVAASKKAACKPEKVHFLNFILQKPEVCQ